MNNCLVMLNDGTDEIYNLNGPLEIYPERGLKAFLKEYRDYWLCEGDEKFNIFSFFPIAYAITVLLYLHI